MHYSNVQIVDPVTGKPVRIGHRFLEDGTKARRSCVAAVVPLRLAEGASVFSWQRLECAEAA